MKTTFYLLADGQVVNELPRMFEGRDKLKERAESIVNRLKWTKKVKDKDGWMNIWLNDEDVQEYRKLLREIWSFVSPFRVVDSIEIQECNLGDYSDHRMGLKDDYDILYHIEKDYRGFSEDQNYVHDEFVCESCLAYRQRQFGKKYIKILEEIKITPKSQLIEQLKKKGKLP